MSLSAETCDRSTGVLGAGLVDRGYVGRKAIKCGRPLGPVARAVLEALTVRPMTAREVAAVCLLRCNAAEYTCRRLLGAGLIRVAERVAVPGAYKRVARYMAAVDASASDFTGFGGFR